MSPDVHTFRPQIQALLISARAQVWQIDWLVLPGASSRSPGEASPTHVRYSMPASVETVQQLPDMRACWLHRSESPPYVSPSPTGRQCSLEQAADCCLLAWRARSAQTRKHVACIVHYGSWGQLGADRISGL